MPYDITEEEFREYIPKDIEEAIYSCITSAIKDHKEQYRDLNYRHSGRTNANIIHDLIVHNVKTYFQNRQDTRCYTKRNCFQLVINNGSDFGKICIIRFKKLNKNRIASHNIPQYQISEYEQMNLLGPTANLNAGYMFTGLDVSLFITSPSDSKRNEWEWELSIVASAKPVLSMPTGQNESGLPDRVPKSKEVRSEENAVQE